MFPTEYDLSVSEMHLRELRNEMKAIRLANLAQGNAADEQSLLDRLFAFARIGGSLHLHHGKVEAAA